MSLSYLPAKRRSVQPRFHVTAAQTILKTLEWRHRWAVASRRTLARWADSTAAIVVVALALVAGLWWWSPGQAFDHWVTALVLVALTIGAVAMLVARIRHEFPSHARTDDDMAVPGVGSP